MDNTSPPDPSTLTDTYKFKLVIDIMLLLLDLGLVAFVINFMRGDLSKSKVKLAILAALLIGLVEFNVYLGYAFKIDAHYHDATLPTVSAGAPNPFALDDIMQAAQAQVASLGAWASTSPSTAAITPDISNLVSGLRSNLGLIDIQLLSWQATRNTIAFGLLGILGALGLGAGAGYTWYNFFKNKNGNWWVPTIITCALVLCIPPILYPFVEDLKDKGQTAMTNAIKTFKVTNVATVADLNMGVQSLLLHVPGITMPVAQFTGVIVTGSVIFVASLAAATYAFFWMKDYTGFKPYMVGMALAVLAVVCVIFALSTYYMRLVGSAEVIGAPLPPQPTTTATTGTAQTVTTPTTGNPWLGAPPPPGTAPRP